MSAISNNQTSMLKAWLADAEEFEIPEATQRGLAFMLALDITFNPPTQDKGEMLELMKLFSKNSPKIPEGMGGYFFNTNITDLLAEFAFKVNPEFEPRVISTTEEGEDIRCFNRPEKEQLPPLDSDNMSMESWDRGITSLFHQIGENIEEDIEGAYLAGFKFCSAYYPMDNEGTALVARISTSSTPPHFTWFRRCLNFPPEEISKGNGMQKVLDCFMGDVHQDAEALYRLVCTFSDQLHYSGLGQKRKIVWDADLPSFTHLAATSQMGLEKSHAKSEWLLELKNTLTKKGMQLPHICSSEKEAMNVVRDQVEEQWGYDIFTDYDNLYSSQQWVRRACVLFVCSANAVLEPTWNLACAKSALQDPATS